MAPAPARATAAGRTKAPFAGSRARRSPRRAGCSPARPREARTTRRRAKTAAFLPCEAPEDPRARGLRASAR
ncbi:MAG: hypothetical protein FJ253_05620 [Phycisphaerae bacterium]|nr:hypothetical protein [Phycisphaerae bacterium]